MSKHTPGPWSKKAIAAILRNASKHDGIWLEECGEDEYIPDQDDAALIAVVPELLEALAWYGEQARLARLIRAEGDAGRHRLAADGGKRARAIIAKAKGEEC